MANVGPLMDEIGLPVWGTSANLNRFRFLASLLQRRRSPEANQTLHDDSRLLGWYTIYTFSGAVAPWRNFVRCKIHFTFKSCVLLYWQRYCTALQQRPSAKVCGMVQGTELRNFRRGRRLYLAGRPSRNWASTHILVLSSFDADIIFMVALWNRADHYIFPCDFYLLSIFFFRRLISAVWDWMSTILPHVVWP